MVKRLPAMWETGVWSLDWEDLLQKEMATHSSILGLPSGSAGKESACNVGDRGLIPGLGRSHGERKSYPLQDSGLENSKGITKSQIRLSDFHFLSLSFTCGGQKSLMAVTFLVYWHGRRFISHIWSTQLYPKKDWIFRKNPQNFVFFCAELQLYL